MASDQFVDMLVSIAIIGGGILVIAARVTKQTIGEMIRGIIEAFQDTTEETSEAMISYE